MQAFSATLALEILVFGGAEDGEEFGRGLGGNQVLADAAICQQTADGGQSLQVRTYGVTGAHDEDDQVDRLIVEGSEVQAVLDGGSHHAHAVHVVDLGVRNGEAATDTGGSALFAIPYGVENFGAMIQLVGTAESVYQFVQDCFLGRARRVDQDAIVYKPFGKTHRMFFPYENYCKGYLANMLHFLEGCCADVP